MTLFSEKKYCQFLLQQFELALVGYEKQTVNFPRLLPNSLVMSAGYPIKLDYSARRVQPYIKQKQSAGSLSSVCQKTFSANLGLLVPRTENAMVNIGKRNTIDVVFVGISDTSPGNLWFDWKQIATVLILPQCNSMMYLAKVLDYNMVYSQGLPNDKKVG